MEKSGKEVQEALKQEAWWRWGEQAGRVVLVLAIAWIVTRLVRWAMRRLRRYTIRVMNRHGGATTFEMEKRTHTLISALSKAINTVIWTLAVVTALQELNFHVEPLLAGLGIAGVALGFGAQTIIRDWLGGFFLLLEDRVRIGDVVMINDITGIVEELDLRTTVLRGENGAVHVITNGSITALSNLTRDYSYYVFETTLAHGADADRALAIIESTADEIYRDEQFRPMIVSPIEMMGVDRLADRGVVVKARIKTLPAKQALVGRELNRRIRIKLGAEGITFPPLLPPPLA
jgi:moderate conductance mechanosensitive channel